MGVHTCLLIAHPVWNCCFGQRNVLVMTEIADTTMLLLFGLYAAQGSQNVFVLPLYYCNNHTIKTDVLFLCW